MPHPDFTDVIQDNGTGKAMKTNGVELRSLITCPDCGQTKEETMPTDSCLFFYVCEGCRTRLKPEPGDCCVFCSYGTVKCPPIQTDSRM